MSIHDDVIVIGLHSQGASFLESLYESTPSGPTANSGFRALAFTLDSDAPKRPNSLINYHTGAYGNIPIPSGIENISIWSRFISVYNQLLRKPINNEIRLELEKMDKLRSIVVARDTGCGVSGCVGSNLLADIHDDHTSIKGAVCDMWLPRKNSNGDTTPINTLNNLLSHGTAEDYGDAILNLNDAQGRNDQCSWVRASSYCRSLFNTSLGNRNYVSNFKPLTFHSFLQLMTDNHTRPVIQPFIEEASHKWDQTKMKLSLAKIIQSRDTHGFDRDLVISAMAPDLKYTLNWYNEAFGVSAPPLRGGSPTASERMTIYGGICSDYYTYMTRKRSVTDAKTLIKKKAFVHHYTAGSISGETLFEEVLNGMNV